MKKFSKAQALVTAAATAAVMAPAGAALASSYDYNNTASGIGFFAGSLMFLFALLAVGLGFFIFWVLMLVDALQRQNWRDDSQKNLWLIILIVSIFAGFAWLAAIVYYFAVRKPLGRSSAKKK